QGTGVEAALGDPLHRDGEGALRLVVVEVGGSAGDGGGADGEERAWTQTGGRGALALDDGVWVDVVGGGGSGVVDDGAVEAVGGHDDVIRDGEDWWLIVLDNLDGVDVPA